MGRRVTAQAPVHSREVIGVGETELVADGPNPESAVAEQFVGTAHLQVQQESGGRLSEKRATEVGKVSGTDPYSGGNLAHLRLLGNEPREDSRDLITLTLLYWELSQIEAERLWRKPPNDAPEQRLKKAVLNGIREYPLPNRLLLEFPQEERIPQVVAAAHLHLRKDRAIKKLNRGNPRLRVEDPKMQDVVPLPVPEVVLVPISRLDQEDLPLIERQLAPVQLASVRPALHQDHLVIGMLVARILEVSVHGQKVEIVKNGSNTGGGVSPLRPAEFFLFQGHPGSCAFRHLPG